jgi:hypothetical protein
VGEAQEKPHRGKLWGDAVANIVESFKWEVVATNERDAARLSAVPCPKLRSLSLLMCVVCSEGNVRRYRVLT